MSDHLRDVPELHEAIRRLADEHTFLDGPIAPNGRRTRYLPCDACSSVVAVEYGGGQPSIVSLICEDCAAPCANVECGLLVHEHREQTCEWEVAR